MNFYYHPIFGLQYSYIEFVVVIIEPKILTSNFNLN